MLCLIYGGLSFYDMRALSSSSSDYSIASGNNTYYFNLCGYTVSECNGDSVYAYLNDGSSCIDMTDNETDSITNSIVTINGTDLVQFYYANGAVCSGTSNYSLTLNAMCDESGSSSDSLNITYVDVTDECAPVITFYHKDACPEFTANTLVKFLVNH